MIRAALAVVKADIMAASSGTQTVMTYPKSLGGFVIDLLEKLNEVKGIFGAIKEELNRGQQQINQSDNNVNSMEVAINGVSTTMDTLSERMLENNVDVARRNLQIQKIRQEVAAKKELLRKLLQQAEKETYQQTEQTIIVLKKERALQEQRLRRINYDIETVHEFLFEVEEKLTAFRTEETHQAKENVEEVVRKDRVVLYMDSIDLKNNVGNMLHNGVARTLKNLRIPKGDYWIKQWFSSIASLFKMGTSLKAQPINMQELYVSNWEFRRVQAEIDEMKHKQVLIEKHITAQLEEREFLRQTADEIVQKVYNLEKIVRKEKGDQNPESPNTVKPIWRQDLSGPKLWYQAPTFTVQQLKKMMADEYQQHPASRNWTEEPGTSGFGDAEDKIETTICLESK